MQIRELSGNTTKLSKDKHIESVYQTNTVTSKSDPNARKGELKLSGIADVIAARDYVDANHK